MIKKMLIISMTVFVFTFVIVSSVYASLLDIVISSGNSLSSTPGSDDWSFRVADILNDNIVPAVQSVGYLVFAIVTIFLGVKYMWSGYEGKSTVKDTLPTFLVSMFLFYFASTIVSIINETSVFRADSWDVFSGNIFGLAVLIVQYLSFGTLLFVGLKYMFASPEGKSKIKETMVPLVIGMVFVFLSSTLVNTILTAMYQVVS